MFAPKTGIVDFGRLSSISAAQAMNRVYAELSDILAQPDEGIRDRIQKLCDSLKVKIREEMRQGKRKP